MKKWTKVLSVIIIISAIILAGMILKDTIYKVKYKNRIAEVTADDVEIERKWLIDKENIKYDLSKATVYEIEQTYINFSPEIRVRRVNDTQYSFTLKRNMSEDGLIRDEIDFLITEDEYNELVSKKVGNTIYKTRYKLLDDGMVVTIDIFKGELDGLAYLEIEFANEKEAKTFKTPDWVIKDVTDDVNYKNASLAQYGIPNSEKLPSPNKSSNSLKDEGYEYFGYDYCTTDHTMEIGGCALTDWSCRLCGVSAINPDTNVPELCGECAKITDRCHQCGKRIK